MRIAEYMIISGFEADFIPEINLALQLGWQPYGSLIRDQFGCNYQALTRTDIDRQALLSNETIIKMRTNLFNQFVPPTTISPADIPDLAEEPPILVHRRRKPRRKQVNHITATKLQE